MRGLLAKTVREVRLTTALFGGALFVVMALLTYVLPQVQEGLSDVLSHMPFVKTLMASLLGTEIGEQVTMQMMGAYLWVHPIVLALLWAHEIVICTRMPAGEIDIILDITRRGTGICKSG